MRLTRRLAGMGLGLALALPFATLPARTETPPDFLVIAATIDDIVSLDPQESFEFSGSDILNNLYGSLVSFDPADLSRGYIPEIAESWEVSDDGRVFTFRIRDGLKFTSGNPVTARDVEYSLRRAVAMQKTPSFIVTQFGFTPENLAETLVALDDRTFRLTTDRTYAESFVLNCLTATIAYVVDSETVKANEADGDWGNAWLKVNSAGSGAYRLVNWKPNESYTIEANPDFWRGAPAMRRVIVQHIPESATQRLLLEKGDVDIARNLSPEDVGALEGKAGLAVDSDLRGRIMYLALSQKHPVLSHPKVIEAFKWLVDYEGMANSFLKGQYTVHQAFLPLTYLGALEEKPYSLDIARAKALLAEAGVTEGLTVEIAVRTAQERVEIAQVLQSTLAQVGITVNITQGTGKEILARYRGRNFDVALEAWGPDYPDPHTNADTFAHNPDNSDEAQLTGKLAWRASWDIPEMTKATEAAVVEADREKRAEMYREIQREFQRTAPFIPMFQKIEQIARKASVKGFQPGAAITAAFYWTVTK